MVDVFQFNYPVAKGHEKHHRVCQTEVSSSQREATGKYKFIL